MSHGRTGRAILRPESPINHEIQRARARTPSKALVTGPKAFVRDRIFYEGDAGDRALLRRVVDEHPDLDATIHMAARIVVPESVELPYEYYRDNVAKSLELFDELERLGKPRILFSSTASLYALQPAFEVRETDPV